HLIPRGGLFNYVSCPHYFTEIIIYLSFFLISNCHNSWFPLLFWVTVSQLLNGQVTHQWYKSTFPKYPSNRKAVIPFIF
ncbi:putative polyprenol reductase-like protein, partial [Leptotrombidium deliense]